MVTACGLQTDSEATLFDDIPYGLAETSTSTTTTTIATDPAPGTTTTTVAADQQTVDVVYVRRFSRELESTQVDLPFPVSGRDLLDQLSSPPADAQPELETEVSRGLVLSFGVDRGLATVNLSRSRSINSEALNNAGPSPRSFSPSRSSPQTRVVSVRSYFLSAANQSASTFRYSDQIANPDNQWHGPTTHNYSLASTPDHRHRPRHR